MLSLHGNGERFAPVRISSYGEGGRPEIDGDGSYAGVFLQGVSHYILENLRVANRAGERTVRQGICVEAKEEGITEYITIRNCEVLEVAGENRRARDVYCSMYWNGGIYITIPGRSSEKNHLHHIHILNNHIHDVRTSGIRINQEEDFINDIHHTSIVVRGNRIERTGSDGIRALFCHNHYDAQVCPHDMQRMEKSGIDVRRLLEHAGDGMEWLQDQWELLNRLLMRDCVD